MCAGRFLSFQQCGRAGNLRLSNDGQGIGSVPLAVLLGLIYLLSAKISHKSLLFKAFYSCFVLFGPFAVFSALRKIFFIGLFIHLFHLPVNPAKAGLLPMPCSLWSFLALVLAEQKPDTVIWQAIPAKPFAKFLSAGKLECFAHHVPLPFGCFIFSWHSLHSWSWIEKIPPHFGQVYLFFCWSIKCSKPCAWTKRLFSIRLAWYRWL